MSKKVFLRTFGCQMNERDSEFAAGILLENGFSMAKSPETADVILFNSCAVRKHAEDRLFSNIAALKHLKRKKPELLVGLLGCVAQSFGGRALTRAPFLDFVCGPGNIGELPLIISGMLKDRMGVIATGKIDAKRPELFPRYRAGSFKAYVSIGEGCDNYCSYCIVPYVRGRERSRCASDIVREVRDLGRRGFKEITLLGQNVNSYEGSWAKGQGARRCQGGGFARLLEEINRVQGIERIRFMTSHPKDASATLFKAMRDLPKVCRHLHLPLQSGSDRILRLMNRQYTAAEYLKLVASYRKIVPGGSMTTDIIVGFPTEKEKDFRATVALMKKVGFDGSYQFKYSARPPAKAANLPDDIPERVKEERLATTLALQSELSLERNLPLAGKAVEVLVDGASDKTGGMLAGRTGTNKTVIFGGPATLTGKTVLVKVRSVTAFSLRGEIIT